MTAAGTVRNLVPHRRLRLQPLLRRRPLLQLLQRPHRLLHLPSDQRVPSTAHSARRLPAAAVECWQLVSFALAHPWSCAASVRFGLATAAKGPTSITFTISRTAVEHRCARRSTFII